MRSQGTFSKAVLIECWGREVLVGAEEGLEGQDSEQGYGRPLEEPHGQAYMRACLCVGVGALVHPCASACAFTMGGSGV